MTPLFANILCRPGPSMIPALGADLYSPLHNWTTNTLLDAYIPRTAISDLSDYKEGCPLVFEFLDAFRRYSRTKLHPPNPPPPPPEPPPLPGKQSSPAWQSKSTVAPADSV